MGLQKLSTKNKRTSERIVFRLKLYGKLNCSNALVREKNKFSLFLCKSLLNSPPSHKQSAATKSKYSALGPEATSINSQVWARNSFNLHQSPGTLLSRSRPHSLEIYTFDK